MYRLIMMSEEYQERIVKFSPPEERNVTDVHLRNHKVYKIGLIRSIRILVSL